jgi:hypothetical protein
MKDDLYVAVAQLADELHRETWKRNVECEVCPLNDRMPDCQMHYEECPAVKRQLRSLKYHLDCIDLEP